MSRLCFALSIGLFVLWLVHLNEPSTNGLHWFDFVGAVSALILAGTLKRGREIVRVGGLLGLASGLLLVWVAGLASSSSIAFTWANFIFAGSFVILGLIAVSDRPFLSVDERIDEAREGEPPAPVGAAQPYFDESRREMRQAAQSTSDFIRPDGRIEEEIQARLLDRWDLDARQIKVRVREGVAILSGQVTNDTEKKVADFVAESVRGVLEVRNELEALQKSPEVPRDREVPPRVA